MLCEFDFYKKNMPATPLSIHNDVLNAPIPTEESSINSLISELKNRAKVGIQSRNYPTAEALYTKAIKVVNIDKVKSPTVQEEKDAAILYSNRSLARLHMNQVDKALEDAQQATKLDPKYVKGFWRLGSAYAAKEDWRDAIEAFKDAVIIEPKNKAFLKEIERCEKMKIKADELKKKMEEEKKDDEKSATTTTMKKIVTKSTSSVPKPKTEKVISKDNAEFTSSDHVRGYKIVGGKKTSFFHNEQTEEVKRLIGDITPKRIDPASTQAPTSTTDEKKAVSAWNKAGTWEEKDVTSWARDELKTKLLSSVYTLPASSPSPGSVARVTKVKSCNGHASVATARGKRRYIYEFDVELEWTMTLLEEDEEANGKMCFPDIDGTCDEGEYEMINYSVDSSSPSSAKHILDRFVKNGGLRDEVIASIDTWVAHFKETYA